MPHRPTDPANGIAVVRRLLDGRSETILHGAWLPGRFFEALACVLRRHPYVKMPHGSYDPVRLAYHGWKKLLMGPFERWALRHADAVFVTCAAEEEWTRAYEPRIRRIETIDLRRFFDLPDGPQLPREGGSPNGTSPEIRILYLGRLHPLKGVAILQEAITHLASPPPPPSPPSSPPPPTFSTFSLRIVSDHTGEDLERDWAWCDVLCLPTLSENFGLVVAEALARGKRVVTTDGAPAWDPSVTGTDYGGRLVYVRNYREAPDDATRVELLRAALAALG